MQITRKDYLSGRVSHEEYYRSVYREAGLTINKQVAEEVSGTNDIENLNDIRMGIWNSLVVRYHESIRKALKVHGDGFSVGAGVCVMKALYKDNYLNKII